MPLDAYVPPEAPALDVLQRLRDRVIRPFGRGDGPAVQDDRLERAARATVEDYVAVPDCAVVTAEIGAAIDEWLADETPNARVLLVALAPCETRGLVERVARERGFECLAEPARGALAEPGNVPGPAFDASATGVLAVPRLERWFLRHRHGLAPLRALLGELADTERRCLVGVNSWAWGFAAKAARADLVLPAPLTVRPFDARRLRDWLVELARDDDTADVAFRAMDDDADVLATDEAGEPVDDFLAELASRAHGISWVAWQLWRRGLRTLPVDDEKLERVEGEVEREADAGAPEADDPRTEAERLEGTAAARREAAGDSHTMWVVREAPLLLPAGHEHDACLVLHALLIHAFLTVAELELVVPIVGPSGIVRALERAGFVERAGDGFRCRPAAYPSIRTALDDAGYPLPPV